MKTAARLIAVCLTLQTALVCGGEWGDLTGKFVVAGDVPPPRVVDVKAAGNIIGPAVITDETLVVSAKGELQNVAIWIAPDKRETAPAPHPDYQQLANVPVYFDAQNLTFVPHVQAIWTARPVRFRNLDIVAHNFNVNGFLNPLNLLVKPANAGEPQLNQQEPLPSPVSSSIFPWMRGYLVIRDTPYVAISGADGTFTIKNLPAGQWTFAFWHETGYLANQKIGDLQTDRRGRCQILIEAGKTTDLGEIVIDVGDLK